MALDDKELGALIHAVVSRMDESTMVQIKQAGREKGRELVKKTLGEIARFGDSPEGRAQTAFIEALQKMETDPVINQSEACLQTIRALLLCFEGARWFECDALNILGPLGKPLEAKELKQRGGKRYAKNKAPRLFVQSEWQKHKEAYKNNKTDFVKAYVARVKNEYEVTISFKQMHEVWLKGL